jgi:hypothetical protein
VPSVASPTIPTQRGAWHITQMQYLLQLSSRAS